MLTPIAVLLGILGSGWGFVADRIGARWPAHDDGGVRPIDWRTPVAVITGGLAFAALPGRFAEPVPALIFGGYLAALTVLLATDLDQRLLPDVITLPAIPLALAVDLLGVNPLVPPGVIPVAILVAIALPGLMYLLSLPFGAGAFGQGDVKLLVSVGLLAGPFRMFSGVLYGMVLAAVVILVLMAFRRITLKSYIPLGPFLIFGAIWAILVVP